MSLAAKSDNVDYRLLGFLSEQVICSSCLRQGRITPVPQIVSHRHTPRSLCRDCAPPKRRNLRRILTHLPGL